jgi:hypothetical protein
MFQSLSRAPHHRPRQVVAAVRDAILRLRDGLKAVYGRVVGAKTILYHFIPTCLFTGHDIRKLSGEMNQKNLTPPNLDVESGQRGGKRR